jgi:hypothetical protein
MGHASLDCATPRQVRALTAFSYSSASVDRNGSTVMQERRRNRTCAYCIN